MPSVDETKALLDFLTVQAGLTALTSTRIWADVEFPPAGYTPAAGPGICFKVRGGSDNDPYVLLSPSFQFKCYGASEVLCRQTARALHDVLDLQANKDILTAVRETMPVTLKEPDADWTYALVFYRVMVRSL